MNSQAKFEKGYFITLDGKKTACLIKNEDWLSIPSSIYYKLDEKSKTLNKSQGQLKKIKILDKFDFERHIVDIERYSNNLNELSNTRISNYKKESLLLKVVVDANVKLLKYSYRGVNHFYYIKADKIYPLEYKLYKTKNENVGKNLNFRKTLKEKLNCNSKILDQTIKYRETKLVKYFTAYNSCNNSSTKTYSNQIKTGKFNARPKISLGYSGIKNYSSKFTLKFGIELEYILPFNNYKWSVFSEPTFQSFSSEEKLIIGYNPAPPSNPLGVGAPIFGVGKTEYSSIEIPIGVRYYSLLNKKNKLFYNTGASIDIVLNDKLFIDSINNGSIQNSVNYFFGLGYEFNKKVSVEIRYNTFKILGRSNGKINFNNTSLMFGYNLL